MRAVVTGASGFIGSYLVNELTKNGYTVYGVGTSIEKLRNKKFGAQFIPIEATFEEYEKIYDHLSNEEIDIFYHLAWQGGFTDALSDYALQFMNAKAACDAMVAAQKIGCKKFVFAGTVNEIEIKQFMNNENFVPRNTCIYASAKMAADMICKTLAHKDEIQYCSALIPLPYGVGNASRQLINVLIKNCYENKPTKLIEGNNQYDIAHIDDVARALRLIGEKGKNYRSYYIGHRKLRKFKEIVTEIRDVINPEAELRFGEYMDSLNMDYSLIDLDALYRDTGFECRAKFNETIQEQAEYLRRIGF